MSDIILYGRGKTGIALQKMTSKLGYNPVFYDDTEGFCGEGHFDKDITVVTSPGVKPFAKGMTLAKQAGAKIVGELDFCFPCCKGRCVSVTGTNGKTTTCQLIYHVLQQNGKASRLLGNGGVAFSEQVLEVESSETVVLESSSFQLDNAKVFSPYISVLTNVAPDHLDYHGNFANYVQAKCNNFCHQQSTAYAVFNADDATAMSLSCQSPAHTLYYSTNNPNANCYFCDNTVHLCVNGIHINYQSNYFSTLAKHNLSNALCAVLVCYLLGVSLQQSCRSIQGYKFLPHRLQQVCCFNGVTFVDDSKATNVHATVSALSCYENTPLALILGGSDKGCAFDDIFLNIKTNVRMICAVGQTAPKIVQCGKKYLVDVAECSDYKQAVGMCYRKMKNIGGVVLMSNACASFDMFESYAQRGERFVQLVKELCGDEKKI